MAATPHAADQLRPDGTWARILEAADGWPVAISEIFRTVRKREKSWRGEKAKIWRAVWSLVELGYLDHCDRTYRTTPIGAAALARAKADQLTEAA